MRHRAYETGLCIAFSISVNCLFRYLALRYGLPVRLDSFGTVLAAYLLGPCSGAIVGAATGMLQSLHNSQAPQDPTDTIDLSRGYWENADPSSPSFHYVLDGVIEIE